MAVTLKDIAKKVGVSPTTVSLVLNQGSDSRIGEATQQKILETAQELGYQPLRSSQPPQPSSIPIHPTIGLVISDIRNPFFTELSSVIEDVASRFGYNIILCNTREDQDIEHEFLEVLWRRRVHGLILAPADYERSDLRDFLKHNIPVVLVDRYIEGTDTHAILVDNVEGGYRATEYLIKLGHRRIGIVLGRERITTVRERLQGFLNALRDYGIPHDDALIAKGSLYTVEGGRQAIRQLLQADPLPSAVFSSAGVSTIGALLELKEQGIRIPDDLSFIGFDDDNWARIANPPLTVVSQPVQEMGQEAAQLIIQLIQGWSRKEFRRIVLHTELVIRESCREYHGSLEK